MCNAGLLDSSVRRPRVRSDLSHQACPHRNCRGWKRRRCRGATGRPGTWQWPGPFLLNTASYDPVRDLSPITLVATSPNTSRNTHWATTVRERTGNNFARSSTWRAYTISQSPAGTLKSRLNSTRECRLSGSAQAGQPTGPRRDPDRRTHQYFSAAVPSGSNQPWARVYRLASFRRVCRRPGRHGAEVPGEWMRAVR